VLYIYISKESNANNLKNKTMNFTTKSGISLKATSPSISGGKYFVSINGATFEMNDDNTISTVFESSVAAFMASIGKAAPAGFMRVALALDSSTFKAMVAFVDSTCTKPEPQGISHKQWNDDGAEITYHGTHEVWNGVRMD